MRPSIAGTAIAATLSVFVSLPRAFAEAAAGEVVPAAVAPDQAPPLGTSPAEADTPAVAPAGTSDSSPDTQPLPAILPPVPPPVPPPTPAPPPPTIVPAPAEPLAGFSDGTAFLRSPDNAFVLFPGGRLQLDGYSFRGANKTPNSTFLIRRARAEVTGWIGPAVFFYLAGDFAVGAPAAAAPVAPANLATTDDFVAIAPWGNSAILQVGQFDGPFTLENRTSDKYFDFMERSITVRAFGIPDNKELGAMVHGYNENRSFYYSLGLMNGDGQNFKNADKSFDWMGRAWIAPFASAGLDAVRDIEIGASFWTGQRSNTLAPASQTTQGGFTFLSTASFMTTPSGASAAIPVQLRQNGRMNAIAGELNLPIAHRFGVRGEFVWKHNPLSEENVTSATAPVILGGASLQGWSAYGEAWVWLVGDDRIIGDQQGLEPLPRFKTFGIKPPRNGLMFAFRAEELNETVTDGPDSAALALGNPAAGTTKVRTLEFGLNYWYSKRFRLTANYVVNYFDGDTKLLKGLISSSEQELLCRFAIAL